MKPAPFCYAAAESLEHALALKAEHGDDARFLAGGQSLVPAMNFRLAQPAWLIDVHRLAALEYVKAAAEGELRIGALTRHRTLERDALVARHAPLIAQAMPHIAHSAIRNRGTIGGNLAHADPASELPAIMLALGARLRACSVRGERWIPADAFFRGVFTTALESDEMLVEIAIPAAPPRTGTSFMEIARRRGDYALVGVAASVTIGADGRCGAASLALCNVGPTPIAAAARGLIGKAIDPAAIEAVVADLGRAIDPPANVHASAAFRRHLAGVLTRRALASAADRARSAA